MDVSSTGRHNQVPHLAHSEASSPSSLTTSHKLNRGFAAMLHEKAATTPSAKTNPSSSSGQEIGTTQTSGTGTSMASDVMNQSMVGFNALVQRYAVAPQIQTTTTTVQHLDGGDPVNEAYWSAQPAAVQVLRDMQDRTERMSTAATLASQGYQIDVPIMGWGWDPGKTMALRASAGYTWVPSALGAQVKAAPGLTGSGITPYDPKNPPAGSITVTG